MEIFRKHWQLIVCVLIIGFASAIYYARTNAPPQTSQANIGRVPIDEFLNAAQTGASTQELQTPEREQEPEARRMFVHIEGAITNPGVYEIFQDYRINDVILAAGGLREDADRTRINLSAHVRDAQFIIVPDVHGVFESLDLDSDLSLSLGSEEAQDLGLVNINTASRERLETLPGVGVVIAGYIIDYRENNGGFSSVDELINVPRIGATTLERLRPFVIVR